MLKIDNFITDLEKLNKRDYFTKRKFMTDLTKYKMKFSDYGYRLLCLPHIYQTINRLLETYNLPVSKKFMVDIDNIIVDINSYNDYSHCFKQVNNILYFNIAVYLTDDLFIDIYFAKYKGMFIPVILLNDLIKITDSTYQFPLELHDNVSLFPVSLEDVDLEYLYGRYNIYNIQNMDNDNESVKIFNNTFKRYNGIIDKILLLNRDIYEVSKKLKHLNTSNKLVCDSNIFNIIRHLHNIQHDGGLTDCEVEIYDTIKELLKYYHEFLIYNIYVKLNIEQGLSKINSLIKNNINGNYYGCNITTLVNMCDDIEYFVYNDDIPVHSIKVYLIDDNSISMLTNEHINNIITVVDIICELLIEYHNNVKKIYNKLDDLMYILNIDNL